MAKNRKETEETIKEGWLHTGDIGVFDAEGFLIITDRKKHLFKTTGGKYIAPTPIENMFLASKYIEQFVLIGDNLLEFFSDSHDYYEEWYDDIKEKNGWIIALNFREHIISEMQQANIHYYISTLFFSEDLNWRKFKPLHLISFLEDKQLKILE